MSEFYLKGREIFKRPCKSPTGVSMGFRVCEVDEWVDPPEAVLEIFNRGNSDALVNELLSALESVTDYAQRQICNHEETYRGGIIWEICSTCGAKWADDEGGKPEYKAPKEITEAYAAIDKAREIVK